MKSNSYFQPGPDGESLMLVFPRTEEEHDPQEPPTDWDQVKKDPWAYIAKRVEKEQILQEKANQAPTATSPATPGRSRKKKATTTTKTPLSSNEPPA